MIDLLYVSFNRLELTRESFSALIENTDWNEVATIFIADDGSEDGTREYLITESEILRHSTNVEMNERPFGGPVAAMNWYLEQPSEGVETFAKIDNDFVVCPGWLPEMLKVLTLNPGLDILGFEPMSGHPTMPPAMREIVRAEHIGGKGLIRLRTFSHCRPRPAGRHGYFGFTEFQTKHPQITKAWISPDLPCFGLDQLPIPEWQKLTANYVEWGWQRAWPPYHEKATDYWDWWLKELRQ